MEARHGRAGFRPWKGRRREAVLPARRDAPAPGKAEPAEVRIGRRARALERRAATPLDYAARSRRYTRSVHSTGPSRTCSDVLSESPPERIGFATNIGSPRWSWPSRPAMLA